MQNKYLPVFLSPYGSVIIAGALLWLLVMTNMACHTKTGAATKRVKHFAEMQTATGSIFIDPVPLEKILSVKDGNSSNTFYSYKVGFENLVQFDKAKETEWLKYVDYSMEKDWVLLVNNDSIPVVFHQPVPKKWQKITESIIVFEVPDDSAPAKMIYRGSNDYSEGKTFSLKNENE